MKDVAAFARALRIANRLQFFLSADTVARFHPSFSFLFFLLFWIPTREKNEIRGENRPTDRIVARRKNGMEIIAMPVLTMRAFSVLYADDL